MEIVCDNEQQKMIDFFNNHVNQKHPDYVILNFPCFDWFLNFEFIDKLSCFSIAAFSSDENFKHLNTPFYGIKVFRDSKA